MHLAFKLLELYRLKNCEWYIRALDNFVSFNLYVYFVSINEHSNALKEELERLCTSSKRQGCLISTLELVNGELVEVLEHVDDKLGVLVADERLVLVVLLYQRGEDAFALYHQRGCWIHKVKFSHGVAQ